MCKITGFLWKALLYGVTNIMTIVTVLVVVVVVVVVKFDVTCMK